MGREHWVETTLGECCQINPRNKVNDESLEVTFVTMSDISDNSLLFKSTQVRSFSEVKKGFTHFAENDILFAKITPCMENGKAALANNLRNGLGCGTTELHVIRPLCGVESAFIYNFVHQPIFRTEAEQRFTGSAGQRRVPVDFLYEYPFPLPPLNEQKRIVEKLDAILPKVKNAKARLEKIPLILKKFRQSVLSAACSGRLTEDWREGKDLPEWEEIRSSDLFSFVTSGSRGWAKYYSETGSLFLRIGNLDHFTVHLDLRKKQYVNPPFGSEGLRTRVQKNDILISITADVGMIGLVPENFEEAYINQHISLARPKPTVNAHYLAWYLASAEGQFQFQEMQRGATKVGLGLEDIKNVKVPLPPLEEQQEIVRQVNKLFALADALEAKYKKAIQRVEKIEQSVLAKAFRGELADPDPNDEPAAELLNRILEEKAKLKSTKKPGSKCSATPW